MSEPCCESIKAQGCQFVFFLKPDFDWNSENQKSQILPGFLFSRKGLGSGKTLSQLHIHYKSLLTRVYSMVMQDAKNIAKLLLLP